MAARTPAAARPAHEPPRLGARLRALRRRFQLTQAALAERMGVSASYLNLIEADKRPLPAELLIALVREFQLDLASFTADDEARTVQDLMEAFADPIFDEQTLGAAEVRELAQSNPDVARAVLTLYEGFKGARAQADALATRLDEADLSAGGAGPGGPVGAGHGTGAAYTGVDRSRVSSEEVSDLLQRRLNHFPDLETGAEDLWRRGRLDRNDLYPGLVGWLSREHGVKVQIVGAGEEPGVLRRFDRDGRLLTLSELLPTRSRLFQLAHTIGILEMGDTLGRIVTEEALSLPESRALARVALANYYAGAVLMPYEPFLAAARETRYDIEVIGRRFRGSFEQVAHRLTTLRRSGQEGVPFHYIRIDVAGNISKRFSASGIRIARFSGACPRWNVFSAFLTPNLIRVQLSQMPDGEKFFCIARMIHKDAGGYLAQHPIHAIGLGCRLEHARELVYARGIDLDNPENLVPVGVNCRVCEQRALPSLRQPVLVDERVRRVSPYAPGTRQGG